MIRRKADPSVAPGRTGLPFRRVALVAMGSKSLGYSLGSRDSARGTRVPSDAEAEDGA
jgi:hypothetical protein